MINCGRKVFVTCKSVLPLMVSVFGTGLDWTLERRECPNVPQDDPVSLSVVTPDSLIGKCKGSSYPDTEIAIAGVYSPYFGTILKGLFF